MKPWDLIGWLLIGSAAATALLWLFAYIYVRAGVLVLWLRTRHTAPAAGQPKNEQGIHPACNCNARRISDLFRGDLARAQEAAKIQEQLEWMRLQVRDGRSEDMRRFDLWFPGTGGDEQLWLVEDENGNQGFGEHLADAIRDLRPKHARLKLEGEQP